MKNLLYIISLCGLLTACDLQEEPYGFYSDDNFYKSETDAESGLLYAYNALTFLEYSRGIFYIGDIPTETMSPKSDEAGDVYQLENWIANRETEQLQYYFKYCYIAINRANTVIDHIQNSSVLSETARRRILGEAYFLRAWNYFNLVRTFGIVPVQTKMVAELSQTTPPMATGLDQLYDLRRPDPGGQPARSQQSFRTGGQGGCAVADGKGLPDHRVFEGAQRSPLYRDAP